MEKLEKFFKFTDKYIIPLAIFAMGFAFGAIFGMIKALLIIG